MGSNQSKPARVTELAGNENSDMKPISSKQTRSRKGKAKTSLCAADEDKENMSGVKSPQRKTSSYSAIGLNVAKPYTEEHKRRQAHVTNNDSVCSHNDNNTDNTGIGTKQSSYIKRTEDECKTMCKQNKSAGVSGNGGMKEKVNHSENALSLAHDDNNSLKTGKQHTQEPDPTDARKACMENFQDKISESKRHNNHSISIGQESASNLVIEPSVSDLRTVVCQETSGNPSQDNVLGKMHSETSSQLPMPSLTQETLITSIASIVTASSSLTINTLYPSSQSSNTTADHVTSGVATNFPQTNVTQALFGSISFGNVPAVEKICTTSPTNRNLTSYNNWNISADLLTTSGSQNRHVSCTSGSPTDNITQPGAQFTVGRNESILQYSDSQENTISSTFSNNTSETGTSGSFYGVPNYLDAYGFEVDSFEPSHGAIAQQVNNYFSAYSQGVDPQSQAESGNISKFDQNYITVRTSAGDTTTKISAKNIKLTNQYSEDLTDENMGIILERPKYPRYATLASRQKSFENIWPDSNKIRWEKLPEAGFVYTGTADCVRCFYCNGGLREWLEDDCPWTEHARYYPHCPHVRYCKGDEFIREVREGTDTAAHGQNEEFGDEIEVDCGPENTFISPNQEAMRIAAEIISDQVLLKKAVHYLTNIQGKSSFNAQELAATAFEIEEGSIVHNIEDTVEDDTDSEDDEDLLQSSGSDGFEEVLLLDEETRVLKERALCKVCLDATASVLFLDCGHMITCPMCAPALSKCAVCRAEIKGTIKTKYATKVKKNPSNPRVSWMQEAHA